MNIDSCVNTHLQRNDKSQDINFLNKVFELIIQYYSKTTTGDCKVIDFKLPDEIESELDFKLYDKPTNEGTLLKYCEKILSLSVRCTHPKFYNQLFAGTHPYSLAGEYITTTQNGSMYTYEIAPVYSIMEKEICTTLASFIGWKSTDSIMTPGGSISNLYGLLCARFFSFPRIKKEGLFSLPKMAIFTSKHSHYSIEKFAIVMGLGTNNVIKIQCDEDGRMLPEDLIEKIIQCKNNGIVPICVNSTIGTTILGAIDPINAIADICEEHTIWHHVDACLGGPSVMIPRLQNEIKGIFRVDSIAWDAHKLWTVPLQCSAFLLNPKNDGIMYELNSTKALYLFQQDKQNYDPKLDNGDKSIQCGRHIDVLKLWLWWKGKGTEGIISDSETCLSNTDIFANLIKNREGFELLFRPQFIQVCFFYIPLLLRGLERDDQFYSKLDSVAVAIKSEMIKKGDMMIGYQRDYLNVNYFRMVLSNPATTTDDMIEVLDEIEKLAKFIYLSN